MKLEWGRKVHCPACAISFYTMQNTSLICPGCGNKFEEYELNAKKANNATMDEVVDVDDKAVVSDFVFEEDIESDVEIPEDIQVKTDIEDIKLVDEE